MQGTENAAALLGRVAMSVVFILAGWGKLLAPAATQAMLASRRGRWSSSAGYLPSSSNWRRTGDPAAGCWPVPVGLVLAIWCVATALIAHTNFADRNQEINFLKNMAMTGGFLYVAAFGARASSLDAWWSRPSVAAAR